MKKAIVFVFAMVLSTFAVAGVKELPVTRVVDSPAFDTIEEAVIAAFRPLVRPFADTEYGGAIILRGGKFYYTEAVTTGTNSSLDFRLVTQKGDKLVGMYHTHPLESIPNGWSFNKITHGFSPSDVELAHRLKVVSFLAEELGDALRVIDPTQKYIQGCRYSSKEIAKLSTLYGPAQSELAIAAHVE
jgi:hypothetical protein